MEYDLRYWGWRKVWAKALVEDILIDRGEVRIGLTYALKKTLTLEGPNRPLAGSSGTIARVKTGF